MCDRLMYRSQHFGVQHIGGSDDDTFVPEIVPEVLLHPGGVFAEHGVYRYVELNLVNLLPPKQQSAAADQV